MSGIDGGNQPGLLDVLRERRPALFVRTPSHPADPIAAELEKLALRYGAASAGAEPSADVYREVKSALSQGASGVAALPASRLIQVPHVLLYGRVGRSDRQVVDAYLARLGEAGGHGARRLWTHYLLSLEDDDLATVRIAAWLRDALPSLPDRLMQFTTKYASLEPPKTHHLMAIEMLKGDDLAKDFERIGLGFGRVVTSALMASILGSVGRLLTMGANPPRPEARVREVLGDGAKLAFDQTEVRDDLKKRLLSTFIEGFVAWQRRVDPGDSKPEPVLDLLTTVNLDPRFSPGRWKGVDDKTVAVVEKWLTRQTIEAFFRVVNRLQTDRPDMWKERRDFWLQYMEFVGRAWLILGDSAIPLAKEEKVRHGRFGSGASHDHCGLLIEIDGLRVLEMNKNGRAIMWHPGKVDRKVFPDFNREERFDRSGLTASVQTQGTWANGAIGLAHHSGWQGKFANQIQQNTARGIRPRGV